MDFKSTLETIESSKIFKKFLEENKNSELVAGFFILDLLAGNNQKSLDYRVGDKMFTFSVDDSDEITLKEEEIIKDPRFPELQKIKKEFRVDLDEIPSIAEKAAIDNEIDRRFQKIIAVLQLYQGVQVWNLTCMMDGFVILNIIIDCNTGETVKFEKKNMADFIKKV